MQYTHHYRLMKVYPEPVNLIATVEKPATPAVQPIDASKDINGIPSFVAWVLAVVLIVDKIGQYLSASKNFVNAYNQLSITQLTHHKNIETKLAQLYALTGADRAIVGVFKGGSGEAPHSYFYKKTMTAKYEVTSLARISETVQDVPLRKLVDDLVLNSTSSYRTVRRQEIAEKISTDPSKTSDAASTCLAYLDSINIEQKDIIFLGSQDNIEGILELQYTKEVPANDHWLNDPELRLQGYKLTNQIRHSLHALLNPTEAKLKVFLSNLFFKR